MPPIISSENLNPEGMAALLKQALPPGHLALLRLLADEAVGRSLPLYIIGGFVRDLLVGHPGLDFDLVVEGDAVALARSISEKYAGKVTIHPRFGTASWQLDSASIKRLNIPAFEHGDLPMFDLVSTRSEIYTHPGALPTVKRGTLADDLSRRDFTINTLAIRLDGEHFGQLVDQLGGLEDLQKGLVRVLHTDSYVDDPTRILRAVRYEARYGFKIVSEDLELIAAAKSHLGGLSGERLRHEVDLILAENKSAAMLARLSGLDVLGRIHSLLTWDAQMSRLFENLNKSEPDSWKDVPDVLHLPHQVGLSYLLWLGRLAPTAIQELASSLDFTASLREALLALSSLHAELPDLVNAKPSVVVFRLDDVPLLAVCAACLSANEPTRQILENYLAHWRYIKPKTTGHDLVKLGLQPGPAFKIILSSLRTAWLDGELRTKEEEMILLDKLIKLV